jgi:hypothetical protein
MAVSPTSDERRPSIRVVTRIATHRQIRIDEAAWTQAYFHVGVVDTAGTATQEGAEGSEHVDGDGAVIHGAACHGIDIAVQVLVLNGTVLLEFEILLDGERRRQRMPEHRNDSWAMNVRQFRSYRRS